MKKGLCMAIVSLGLLLCGCVKSGNPALPDPEEFEILESRGVSDFDGLETERMVNLVNGNRALVLDGILYSFDFDKDFQPVLARYELTETGLGERTVLAEDCVPEYLSALDGRLYYINSGTIESVGLDGEERQIVREGVSSFLQIQNDVLYFCDEEERFCRARADGGEEQVILQERCFYPWLSDGVLIYQSDSDSERLHMRWLDDGTDVNLTDHPGYAPVAVAGRLYYSGKDSLMSMGLDGLDGREQPLPGLLGAAELLPAGEGYTLRWIADENGPRQYTADLDEEGGKKLQPEPAAYRGYRLCDFVGDGYRVDTWYYPDGRIRCFVLIFPDGTEAAYMTSENEQEETPE